MSFATREVDPQPFPTIADTAVDQPVARGSIPTLLGAGKLVSPIRPSRWTRFAALLRSILHWS